LQQYTETHNGPRPHIQSPIIPDLLVLYLHLIANGLLHNLHQKPNDVLQLLDYNAQLF
jgi:hypothetical protein